MGSVTNGSFASPLANAQYPFTAETAAGGFFIRVYNGISALSLFATAFVMLVVYDQCNVTPDSRQKVRR